MKTEVKIDSVTLNRYTSLLAEFEEPKLTRVLMRAALNGASALRVPMRREIAGLPYSRTGRLRAAMKNAVGSAWRLGIKAELKKTLAQSIRAKRLKSATGGVAAWVGPKAPHAHLVIGGTQPHEIGPRDRRAVSFGNPPIARRSVRHPGARPNPFVDRVGAANRDRIVAAMVRSVERDIGRAKERARR